MESVLPLPDRDQIERSLQVLFNGQAVIELRAFHAGRKGPQHGYYSDRDKLTTDAFGLAADPQTNCYVILNELRPELASAVSNDMGTGEATKDVHILRRKWVLVDIDPTRAAGTSATDAEKAAAWQVGRSILIWLRQQGFPDPVVVDSGNGLHLLYAVDLANTPAVKNTVKRFLAALGARFDTEQATVDRSVFNAARISKLPGTVARKGPHSDDRPHRTARLVLVPNEREAVNLEQLEQVAGSAGPEPPSPVSDTAAGTGLNIPALLTQHGLEYQQKASTAEDGTDLTVFELASCPWSDDHTTGPGGAAILQFKSGAVTFRCQHSHCVDKTWQDFKQYLGLPTLTVDDLQFGTSPTAAGLEDFRLSLPRPVLAQEAYHGWMGEYALACAEHTEADPGAVLGQLLVAYGVAAGRNAYFSVSVSRHHPLLFLAIVGRTARARKGLSLDLATHIITRAYPEFSELRRGGLSSGEGIVEAVRDPQVVLNKKGDIVEIPGVEDKRGLLVETELAAVFSRMRREGSSLSQVLRQVWDGDILSVLTRKDPLKATGAHLGLIAHITPDELRETLRPADIRNGTANRFVWFYSERSKLFPLGGQLPEAAVQRIVGEAREAITFAQTPCEVSMSREAEQAWQAVYAELAAREDSSLLEELSSRDTAQIRRIALILTLADRQTEMQVHHLRAAVACYEYSRDTLQHSYVGGVDDTEAQEILAKVLQRLGAGLATQTDIYNLFGRNVPAAKLRAVLTAADLQGFIRTREDRSGGGRPCAVYSLP